MYDGESISVYTKPTTDPPPIYLQYGSAHPNKWDCIPYSQLLRLRRICSSDLDFRERSTEFCTYFHQYVVIQCRLPMRLYKRGHFCLGKLV